MEKQEIWARVPKECPFCREQGVRWQEFKVVAAQPVYVDMQTVTIHESKLSVEIRVTCTRCEEEIREEDL